MITFFAIVAAVCFLAVIPTATHADSGRRSAGFNVLLGMEIAGIILSLIAIAAVKGAG